MPNLKNSLRPNGDKQHDLGRDGIRWNKLWVGDIDSNGALLSQNYVYETTYAEQIEFQGLLEVIFPTPPGQNFSLPSTLVKMTGVKVATAVLNSGLTHQFRLVVNGLEIPPSKTELAIIEGDSYIKFENKLLGQLIDITTDPNEANTRIVVWYVPDLSV